MMLLPPFIQPNSHKLVVICYHAGHHTAPIDHHYLYAARHVNVRTKFKWLIGKKGMERKTVGERKIEQ